VKSVRKLKKKSVRNCWRSVKVKLLERVRIVKRHQRAGRVPPLVLCSSEGTVLVLEDGGLFHNIY
jgi:hypothetical protein